MRTITTRCPVPSPHEGLWAPLYRRCPHGGSSGWAIRPPACPRDSFPHGHRRCCPASPLQGFAPARGTRPAVGLLPAQGMSTPAGWSLPNQRQLSAPWKGAGTQGCQPNAVQHRSSPQPLAATIRRAHPASAWTRPVRQHRRRHTPLGASRLRSAQLGITRLNSVSLGWARL